MAKRDKRLYKSLRSAGVRKRAARTAAEAARAEGDGAQRVLGAIAQELHTAADRLDALAQPVDRDRELRDAARLRAAEQV